MIALQVLSTIAISVGLWLGVTSLLSFIAGHFTLVERFPPDLGDPMQEEYFFASGYMGWAHFGNALTVKFGARGLHIGPMILFRPIFSRHLPCIPWGEIEQIRVCDTLVGSYFLAPKFRIKATGHRFSLSGRPGMNLQERLKRMPGPSGAIPSAPIHPK